MALTKVEKRNRIKRRVRSKVYGTAVAPRLSVYRSNKEIYVQLINDEEGKTLISLSSRDKELAGTKGTKTDMAKTVGQKVAEKAIAAGIDTVVFDRNGFIYHGRVEAVAEGAREGGLKF